MSRVHYEDLYDQQTHELLHEALDRKLVGVHLMELVAELSALAAATVVGTGPAPAKSVDEVLGSERAALLKSGTQALPRQAIGRLLAHPHLLGELQELVLVEGGPYWERLLDEDEDLARAGPPRLPVSENQSTTPTSGNSGAARLWLLAIAAAVTIAAFFWPANNASPGAWGWLEEDVLADAADSSAYLNRLADAADEWAKQRPTRRQPLADRLTQFIAGCDRLIEAPHWQLTDDQHQWLVNRCRQWKVELESELSLLSEDRQSPLQTRTNVDEIARRLSRALRDKAENQVNPIPIQGSE